MSISNKFPQSLQNLTITELEMLIETIVKKTLSQNNLEVKIDSTFGTWQDNQSDEEIIEEIYTSRNSNLNLS